MICYPNYGNNRQFNYLCNKILVSDGAPVGGSTSPQTAPTDASVNVEGSISNTRLSQLPWFPSDGKLSLPINTVASTNLEGVTQNDITNRFLALGLNKPNIGHGQCRAPENGQGSCRHIHHCVKPVYFNFFTFLTHMCIIEGRFVLLTKMFSFNCFLYTLGI